jgi:SAM-dependent methyltransferase
VKQRLLTPHEVLQGYDEMSKLYPYIPPLSAWRAWEYAAFRHYTLPEPVLDLGCGDGRLFRLVWPDIKHVIGIDIDPDTVVIARQSGVYQSVHLTAAHQLPVAPMSFGSVFANSSIEHMDHLTGVLASAFAGLQPGGSFLLSVVTEKFVDWLLLPWLANLSNEHLSTRITVSAYLDYHNLVNPLRVDQWVEHLSNAGFEVLDHVPVVPELFGRMFLFMDELWHVPRGDGELGADLHEYISRYPNFPAGFRRVLEGVMQMEADWSTGAGAVFLARRPA